MSLLKSLNCVILIALHIITESSAFHPSRPTEMGLCTKTVKSPFRPPPATESTKFSCLEGELNFCCGPMLNQHCCSLDDFAEQFKTLLALLLTFTIIIALLFIVLIVVSITIFYMVHAVHAEDVGATKDKKEVAKELKRMGFETSEDDHSDSAKLIKGNL